MEIPLAIFYYIYLVFVLIFLLFTFFNIYHLVRFGYLTLSNIIIISFYITFSILMLIVSWHYISEINWQQNIQLLPTFTF